MNARKMTILAFGILLLTVAGLAPAVSAGTVPARPASDPVHHQYLPVLVAARPTKFQDRTPTLDPPTDTNTPVPTTLPPAARNTPVPPSGPTYYVATSGNDSNPGTIDRPWRTIGKAAATLVAGSTVYVRGGVYNEMVNFTRSGTASQPISVLAYPGEVPVLDGNNFTIPSYWAPLLQLSGDYIHASGFEVRNSNWMGIWVLGQHNTVGRMNVHDNMDAGILANGSYSIVEDSQVWRCAYENSPQIQRTPGNWPAALTASPVSHGQLVSYAILRRNVSHDNWGEGLSTFEADSTIIEDNVVYDNYSANLYISDATNVLAQRNLVYVTPNNLMGSSGSQVGIMMGDEKYTPPSANNTVINNFVYGANRNFYWWQGTQGGGLVNALIANNTFVNARAGSESNFKINSGTHSNSKIYNNVIEQDDTVAVAVVGTNAGLSFSNNLWSKTPPSTAAGPNDLVANPQLAKSGTIAPGALTGNYFKLLAGSPARDKALALPQVTVDYFSIGRGTSPDRGGHEFGQ